MWANTFRRVAYDRDERTDAIHDGGSVDSDRERHGERTVGAVSYDANRNLTQLSFARDAQNRLISVSSVSSVVQFAYDARNRCVSRTINGVTTYFYYDDWHLIEERDAAGNQIARYIHGAQVDEILCRITPTLQPPNTPSPLYYSHDALGSVTHLTDASGGLVERYTYDVFGAPTILGPNYESRVTSYVSNRFAFTGREWLAELALYDYRNRVYSPTLGRFLQTDPIGFEAGDVNIYRHVRNAPVKAVDPFGLEDLLIGDFQTDFSSPDYRKGYIGVGPFPSDSRFTEASNWLATYHPELPQPWVIPFPIPGTQVLGLSLGPVIVINNNPSFDAEDIMVNMAHEAMHSRAGFWWSEWNYYVNPCEYDKYHAQLHKDAQALRWEWRKQGR